MENFKTLREFQNLGCQNPVKSALACRVYQNLQTDNKYTNIEKIYSNEFDFIYLSGIDEGKTHFFVPISSNQNCDLVEVDGIRTKLQETYPESILHLAICDTASNVLYFTMNKGFEDKVDNLPRKL